MDRTERKRQLEEFIQEWLNADSEEDEEAQFITKWVIITETQNLNGDKRIVITKANIPPWDALGMMDWAVESFKIRHRNRGRD
jgi:hypothetical protein